MLVKLDHEMHETPKGIQGEKSCHHLEEFRSKKGETTALENIGMKRTILC